MSIFQRPGESVKNVYECLYFLSLDQSTHCFAVLALNYNYLLFKSKLLI